MRVRRLLQCGRFPIEEVVVWTGEIVDLIPDTGSGCWVVWIQTPQGIMFCDCVTEAVWNTLNYTDQYTLIPNPC